MSTDPNMEYIHCNQCGGKKEHKEIAVFKENRDSVEKIAGIGDVSFSWEGLYQTFRCGGCGDVSYRTRTWFSEDDYGDDEPNYQFFHYPHPILRPKPTWYAGLPEDIQSVLDEVYTAIDLRLSFLATFGARTALDMMIVQRIGDIGGFTDKINRLVADGLVTPAERILIEAVNDAGDAAAHRGNAPSPKLLASLMDLLEALLEKFYIADERQRQRMVHADKLKNAIPARPPRPQRNRGASS